mgnify:CR=1 FL=1
MNQGLTIEATYNNWTDETLEFGFLSTDEMMILFGYYYLGESPQVVSLTIQEGWNLVGLPFEFEDTSVEYVFPQSAPGTLYSFNGTYTNAAELELGSGYWLYFGTPPGKYRWLDSKRRCGYISSGTTGYFRK